MPQLASAERGVFLSTVPPSARERLVAPAIVALSLAVFLLLVPFAKVKLGEVWAFIPIYESALLVTDLITAMLLFIQFVILGSVGLLLIAAGYLFAALMTVPHTLSFPRLFATAGWLGSGPQTTAWLYMIWRAGFALAVIAYVPMRGRGPSRRPGIVVAITCMLVVASVIGSAILTTAGQGLLPVIMRGDGYTPLLPVVIDVVWGLNLVALVVLWKGRPHSALDIWLMVVMAIRLCDIALSAMVNAGRFDVGFYTGRIFGLFAGSLVLFVLLVETSTLYARQARSFAEERQDRERQLRELQSELIHVARLTELGQMVSALAHEVNQPLTAVGSYVSAGLRLLHGGDPAKAEDALQKASDQVVRASQVIQRLRQFVKKDDGQRGPEDIRQTVEEAAALALLGTEGRKVRLEMDFAPDTPLVFIDKVRIQQVMLNLIRNSVEAMHGQERRDLLIRAAPGDASTVEISVADNGPGLPPAVRQKLFQPFVTTKEQGMGVGLSLCRSIVEANGGRMWVADTGRGGADFRFTLPIAAPEAELARA